MIFSFVRLRAAGTLVPVVGVVVLDGIVTMNVRVGKHVSRYAVDGRRVDDLTVHAGSHGQRIVAENNSQRLPLAERGFAVGKKRDYAVVARRCNRRAERRIARISYFCHRYEFVGNILSVSCRAYGTSIFGIAVLVERGIGRSALD